LPASTPNEQVDALFDSNTTIGSSTAGTDTLRTFLIAANIPFDAPLGANTILVQGRDSGASVICPVDVVPAAAPAPVRTPTPTAVPFRTATPVLTTGVVLPKTGLPVWVMALFALTLVELGAGLVVFADGKRDVPAVLPQIRRLFGRRRRILR
jgi:hypothetical protein